MPSPYGTYFEFTNPIEDFHNVKKKKSEVLHHELLSSQEIDRKDLYQYVPIQVNRLDISLYIHLI